MDRLLPGFSRRLGVAGGIVAAALGICGCGEDRELADRLVKNIEAIHVGEGINMSGGPPLDDADLAAMNTKVKRRGKLIEDLYQSAPSDPRLPDLMIERWEMMANRETVKAAYADAKKTADSRTSPGVKEAALFFVTDMDVHFPSLGGRDRKSDPLAFAKARFLDDYPRSKYAPALMWSVSQNLHDGRRLDLVKQIARDYPNYDDYYVAKYLATGGNEPATAPLGSTIQMTFKDAIDGHPVDIRGKAVIIDGWATYCASCAARFPELKDLYSKYHAKGLEIVGVPLNDKRSGGLDMVRYFLSKNNCPWPQYYEGGFKSFCSQWGIVGGTLYVVDKSGRLVAVNPDPASLEATVQKLLS